MTHERDNDMAQDKTERVTDAELAAASALTVGDAVFHRVQEGYQDGWPRAVFDDADGEPSGVRCTPAEAAAIAEGAAALLFLPKMARELTALRAASRVSARITDEELARVGAIGSTCKCGQPLSKHAVCGQYDGGCIESKCEAFEDAPIDPRYARRMLLAMAAEVTGHRDREAQGRREEVASLTAVRAERDALRAGCGEASTRMRKALIVLADETSVPFALWVVIDARKALGLAFNRPDGSLMPLAEALASVGIATGPTKAPPHFSRDGIPPFMPHGAACPRLTGGTCDPATRCASYEEINANREPCPDSELWPHDRNPVQP